MLRYPMIILRSDQTPLTELPLKDTPLKYDTGVSTNKTEKMHAILRCISDSGMAAGGLLEGVGLIHVPDRHSVKYIGELLCE